eukprot:COSAG06_NODE_50866_length_315_cov_3.555556_1_plen_51_part_01
MSQICAAIVGIDALEAEAEHTALRTSRERPRAQPHNPRGPLYGSSAAFRLD